MSLIRLLQECNYNVFARQPIRCPGAEISLGKDRAAPRGGWTEGPSRPHLNAMTTIADWLEPNQCDVLIVGGGLVGLTLAAADGLPSRRACLIGNGVG